MKRLFLFVTAIVAMTACVSKSDYQQARNDSDYWESLYEQKCEECAAQYEAYETLRIKYNNLVDEYNDVYANYQIQQSNYNRVYNENEEKEEIITNARNSVRTLKSHFNSFKNGWHYNAYDIERDIRKVENILNGWW